MTVSVLFLAGRFVFAFPFVVLGTTSILSSDDDALDLAWAGLALVSVVGVVLGIWGDVAALVLGLAVLGGGIRECRREGTTDATRVRLVGLVGGAVCIAALYIAVGSALDLTITDPVLDLDLR